MKPISGFSKLNKEEKIEIILDNIIGADPKVREMLRSFWHNDSNIQKKFDEFSENTITNFISPFGVVPNFNLNGKILNVPMVTEESSVVAASAKTAKYWSQRGGIHAEVVSTKKIGQVHFIWNGESKKLFELFDESKNKLMTEITPLIINMEKRGGGITELTLVDKTDEESGYYQIYATFETCDAMGANFINSVLEQLGRSFEKCVRERESFSDMEREVMIVMAILSNYTPECLVKSYVECPVSDLYESSLGMSAEEFAKKFEYAVKISKIDVHRATTHNKGIFNGIDSLVIATGNDFRAVEACGHAYAARDGQYRGLSDISVENGIFKFSIEIPLSLGTVGGLTSLHPLSKFALKMLGGPSAKQLMMITVSLGLIQNFAALRSLVTSGIQKGHMKMHLMNILNQFDATDEEKTKAADVFDGKTVTFNSARDFLLGLRGQDYA